MDVLNPYGSNPKGYLSTPGPDRNGEHMMGTTIMAVEFKGGVVIGADSRTSTGSYVANRVSDKLTKVSDKIYCCRSGSAADTQAVADMVSYYLDVHSVEIDEPPAVKTAANLFSLITYNNKDRLMASIICAGWDKKNGGQVFQIPLGGTLVQSKFAIGGSGSTYIFGHCDAQYKDGMDQKECEAFVSKAIAHAMSRDGSSGGVIRLAIITEKGVERKFIAGDKLPFMKDE
uniref:Proteasome subunit beta n=1 Tax=Lotharella oceanica TaxID=641309 RepID=A0A7S2U2B8_9EUKA|mmetsp:Transcript_4929/g.9801  ORF Transcript_4929/g.9801 Transcript_4929/m.9801 type:complete len:230 (+) Transcript_4929:749-1438(+)